MSQMLTCALLFFSPEIVVVGMIIMSKYNTKVTDIPLSDRGVTVIMILKCDVCAWEWYTFVLRLSLEPVIGFPVCANETG